MKFNSLRYLGQKLAVQAHHGLPMSTTHWVIYSKRVLSISRRNSYPLLRNALGAKFPCGQSEFLRPGSLPSLHPESLAYTYPDSVMAQCICRHSFVSTQIK